MFQQNGYNYDVEMMKHLVDDQVCAFVVSNADLCIGMMKAMIKMMMKMMMFNALHFEPDVND